MNYNELVYKNLENAPLSLPVKSLLEEIVQKTYQDDKTIPENMHLATDALDEEITNLKKMAYLIPITPIHCDDDQWVPLVESDENIHLIGKSFRVSDTQYVIAKFVEQHIESIGGTPAAIYRINQDNRLTFMLYGTTVMEYSASSNTHEVKLSNQFCYATFVSSYPFTVPFPMIATVIKGMEDDGGDEVYASEICSSDFPRKVDSRIPVVPEGTDLFPVGIKEDEFETFDADDLDVNSEDDSDDTTEASEIGKTIQFPGMFTGE